MIDIHFHLLPNIHYDSKSWGGSLDMIKIAVEDGIKGATTHHWIHGTDRQPTAERLRSAVADLNSRIGDAERGCSLKFANLGVLHFISSDAHSKKQRTPVVYNGLAIMEKKIGRDAVGEIISNTYNIIDRGIILRKLR